MSSICPICSDGNNKKVLSRISIIKDSSFDLVQCSSCSLIYFYPIPNSSQLNEFYSANYYNFDRWREEGKGRYFAKNLIKQKEKGNFLDIGCATGYFINGIKNNSKWNVFGCEFSKEAVEFGRSKLNLNIKQISNENLPYENNSMDYIHMNNVLEHVQDPLHLMEECKRVVSKDGLMMLSVPNGKIDSSDMIKFYKIENIPPKSKDGHIYFFTNKSLDYIFEKVGFIPIKTRTYSIKRGLRSSGIIPLKINWKDAYYFEDKNKISSASSIEIQDNKLKKPDFYYQYKYYAGMLKMIPGIHSFGLDFLFILKPK